MCEVSVIMPVYNMAEYLDQSLSSWTRQTLGNIEILCIDDASTDESHRILKEWEKKDKRVRVFHFEENKSAWMARKLGVEKASGQYIMFADADDTISEKACEELLDEMKKSPVDILHFDTEIINVNQLPEKRIESMERFLRPYDGEICGEDVFTACFREQKYAFSLWNKMFSAKLCKEALGRTKNLVLPKAQDKFGYFAISFFAQSYRGLPGRKYYHYYFGRGRTGFNQLSMGQFEIYCSMGKTADAMHDFLAEQNGLECYADIDKKNREALLNDCFARWVNEIPDEKKGEAFDLMLQYWGHENVICKLAKQKWFDRSETAQWLQKSKALRYDRHRVKTIATYYHSCSNGGVQRVQSELCKLWIDMGYNVIVMTDVPESENDYELPENVKRIVLPHYQTINKENYEIRFRALTAALRENCVDVLVYHAWVSNMILWDELTVKLSGTAFIAHCHSVFSVGILNGWSNISNVVGPYLFSDAVITLSDVDRAFWQHYNANVYETINPISESAKAWEPSYGTGKHDVLWLGRLSGEKRPGDPLYILRKVLEKVPDTMLHIVGSNPNPNYMETYKRKIEEMGLEEHVVLHGFHKDVQHFYNESSVFLMTSSYEGYPLALQESKISGIPCVMYKLPYLTLCQGDRGIISVKQNDTTAAANALIELLTDEEERLAYGHQAREHIESLFNFDFGSLWRTILKSLEDEHKNPLPQSERIMMETLIEHHQAGLKKVVDQAKKVSSKPEGGKLVYFALKTERGFAMLKREGWLFTCRRFAQKVRGRISRCFAKAT